MGVEWTGVLREPGASSGARERARGRTRGSCDWGRRPQATYDPAGKHAPGQKLQLVALGARGSSALPLPVSELTSEAPQGSCVLWWQPQFPCLIKLLSDHC